MKTILDTLVSEELAILIDKKIYYSYPVEYIYYQGRVLDIDLFESRPLDSMLCPSLSLFKKYIHQNYGYILNVYPDVSEKFSWVCMNKKGEILSKSEFIYQDSEKALDFGLIYILDTYI